RFESRSRLDRNGIPAPLAVGRFQLRRQFTDPVAKAVLDGEPLGPLHCGNGDFIGDGLAGLADLPMPLPLLDDLPEAERDQDAEDDDPDLAGERAPAVHRFWQVDVHRVAPGGATLAQVPTAATVAAVTRNARSACARSMIG